MALRLFQKGAKHNASNKNHNREEVTFTEIAAAEKSEIKVKENKMSQNISAMSNINGFIGGCLVDAESGMVIVSEGGGSLDLEVAGAANSEVVKAKLSAMSSLGLKDAIEDILITLGKQIHLIRPLAKDPQVFLYVALDRKSANLALARIELKKIESGIEI